MKTNQTEIDSDDLVVQHVERVTGSLRRGEAVLLRATDSTRLLFAAAEHAALLPLGEGTAHANPRLILSATRARRLGHEAEAPIALLMEGAASAQDILSLIDPFSAAPAAHFSVRTATRAEIAALRSVKLASLLPAAIVTDADALDTHRTLVIEEEKLARYAEAFAQRLEAVARARVPLRQAPDTEIIAFRPRFGAKEHLALVVGDWAENAAPLVRLHSSCITGDMLESLRCDCGDQLRESLRAMAQAGGGIVLYLTQEGRGIGIANKLRAYQLQDAGLDTAEANEALGFDADERHFQPAAEMLKKLGKRRIRLMTNNPQKVEALTRYGIEVAERIALSVEPGEHNHKYLATKAERFGHLFG